MTRKITYKNLDTWYEELIKHRGLGLPIIVVANKVDAEPSRAKKSMAFLDRRRSERAALGAPSLNFHESPLQNDDNNQDNSSNNSNKNNNIDMPLYLCSASDGTKVVAAFKEAIRRAVIFKESGERGGTFVDEVLKFIQEEENVAGGLFAKNRDAEDGEEEQ